MVLSVPNDNSKALAVLRKMAPVLSYDVPEVDNPTQPTIP